MQRNKNRMALFMPKALDTPSIRGKSIGFWGNYKAKGCAKDGGLKIRCELVDSICLRVPGGRNHNVGVQSSSNLAQKLDCFSGQVQSLSVLSFLVVADQFQIYVDRGTSMPFDCGEDRPVILPQGAYWGCPYR